MPPDVVRPVASTTIGCLITVAHRLGMIWSYIDPDDGKIRASGQGHSLSASLIRGMGLVVEYLHDGSYAPDAQQTRIPSTDADKVCSTPLMKKTYWPLTAFRWHVELYPRYQSFLVCG